jgi:hypothetical protein
VTALRASSEARKVKVAMRSTAARVVAFTPTQVQDTPTPVEEPVCTVEAEVSPALGLSCSLRI